MPCMKELTNQTYINSTTSSFSCQKNMSNQLLCIICMQSMTMAPKNGEVHLISVCGHFFHSFCVQQWMGRCPAGKKPVCPSCKMSFTADNLVSLETVCAGDHDDEGQVSTLEVEDDGIKDVALPACSRCEKCKLTKKHIRSLRKSVAKIIKGLELTTADFRELLKLVKKAEKILEQDRA